MMHSFIGKLILQMTKLSFNLTLTPYPNGRMIGVWNLTKKYDMFLLPL